MKSLGGLKAGQCGKSTTFSEAIQLRPRFFKRSAPDRNLIQSLICPSSVVSVGGCCPVSPAFDSLWWMPFVPAAFCDHPTLQQGGDDIALSDTSSLVVEKEVANRNASLGLGIEIHAVSRHIKFSLTHLESISSSFTVRLFHLDTFEKRPKFHGNQNRERIAFYRRQRGAPLPTPGGRQAERQTAR